MYHYVVIVMLKLGLRDILMATFGSSAESATLIFDLRCDEEGMDGILTCIFEMSLCCKSSTSASCDQ